MSEPLDSPAIEPSTEKRLRRTPKRFANVLQTPPPSTRPSKRTAAEQLAPVKPKKPQVSQSKSVPLQVSQSKRVKPKPVKQKPVKPKPLESQSQSQSQADPSLPSIVVSSEAGDIEPAAFTTGDPPSSPPQPSLALSKVEFEGSAEILHKKDNLQSKMWPHKLNAEKDSDFWQTARSWCLEMLHFQLVNYEFDRQLAVICGYPPRKNAKVEKIAIDVYGNDEFGVVLGKLRQWLTVGRRDLSVKFVFSVRPRTPAASGPLLPKPSEITEQPVGTVFGAVNTAPGDATSRQLAAAFQTEEVLTEKTGQDPQVYASWTCKQNSCPNYKGYCYRIGSDTPDNHYPLARDHVKMWTKDIKEKLTDLSKPTLETFHALSKHKDLASRKGARHRPNRDDKKGNSMPFVQNFYISRDLDTSRLRGGSNRPSTPKDKVVDHFASDPYLPSSKPPSPAVEHAQRLTPPQQLIEFFAWSVRRDVWFGMSEEIEAIKQVLLAENFDLATVVSMDKATWSSLGLKAGDLRRTVHCARRYIGKLKETRAMQEIDAVDAVNEVLEESDL